MADLRPLLALLADPTRRWPFRELAVAGIPDVAAGVYCVWDADGNYLYAGMSGSGLTEQEVERQRSARRRRGLVTRLASHASGNRSGDRFCIYVADRLVLPCLSRSQLAAIAAGELSLDRLTREYIQAELSFSFVTTADGASARALEARALHGDLPGSDAPMLNGRTRDLH